VKRSSKTIILGALKGKIYRKLAAGSASRVEREHHRADEHSQPRKKQEQAAARKEIKDERKAGLNVDGSLGGGRTGTEDNSAV
jgi:hypothetical protein